MNQNIWSLLLLKLNKGNLYQWFKEYISDKIPEM